MASLFEKVSQFDNLIRQLRKMESKMKAGQFIQSHRECCRVIAELERDKKELIESDGDAK